MLFPLTDMLDLIRVDTCGQVGSARAELCCDRIPAAPFCDLHMCEK